MSLGFLSKKSWHTSRLDNVEKVWIAEQKAEAEHKKLAELQKQLQEERQIQELRQLQAAKGQTVKEVDNSLDWMYSGPSAQQEKEKSAEEFLLGKIYQPKSSSSVKDSLQPEVLALKTSSAPAWEAKVSSKNDSFSRIHEDPLLLIKQQEKKTRESILSNPIKLAKLREQVESTILTEKDTEEKKSSKKSHKEEKKEKKEKKHDDRREDSSRKRDRREERDESTHRRHDRDERDNSRKRDDGSYRSREDRDEYDFAKRSEKSREYHESREVKRDYDYERDRKRTVERLNDFDRSGRFGRDREYSEDRDRQRDSDAKRHRHDSPPLPPQRSASARPERARGVSPSPKARSSSRIGYSSQDAERGKVEGYGLVKGKVNDSNESSQSDNLGPKADLIKKRIEQEKADIIAKKKQSERRPLTEEERMKRLKEMEDDARANEEMRLKRLEHAHIASREEAVKKPSQGDAKFLKSMRSEVYNSEVSVEERLKQNRHFTQHGSDLDSAGFMNK